MIYPVLQDSSKQSTVVISVDCITNMLLRNWSISSRSLHRISGSETWSLNMQLQEAQLLQRRCDCCVGHFWLAKSGRGHYADII